MPRSISTPPTLENSSFRRSLRTKKWKEVNHNESMYEDFHFEDESIEKNEKSKKKNRDRRNVRGKRTEEIIPKNKGRKQREEYDRMDEEMEYVSRKDQFSFHPPSISGGDSAIGSIGTLGSYSEDQFWSSIPNPGAVVRVTVTAKDESLNETIVVTVRNILAREREMRHLATEQGIDNDRWSGSLLYKKVRHAAVKQMVDKRGNYNVTISTMEDGNSNADVGGSDSVNKDNENIPEWTHLLHTVLVPFFSGGKIPVPDQATGPDVLHMLEFFALMYTPSLLDFQTFGAYIRVRLWGEYFFQRGQMYNWIADQIYSSSSLAPKKSIYLVTSPDDVSDDRMQYVLKGTGKRCILFDGGLVVDNYEDGHMKQKNESSCSLVYEFFNADDSNDDTDYENSVDAQLREDFRAFIESTITGSTVTFDMKEVELIPLHSYNRTKYRNSNNQNSNSIIAERAVLHISFSKNPTKSSHKNIIETETNAINTVTPEKQQSLSIEEKDARRKSKKVSRNKNKDDCDIPMITVISSEASMSLASTLSYPHFDKQEKGIEHHEESPTKINTPAIVSPTHASDNQSRQSIPMDNMSHVSMPMQAPNGAIVNQNFVLQNGQLHAINPALNMHPMQVGQMQAISPTSSFQQMQPGQMQPISPTSSFQQMQPGQPMFQQIQQASSNVTTGVPYSLSPTQSMAYSTSMVSQNSRMTQKSIHDPHAAVDEANASWLWTLLTPEVLMSTLCCNPNPNATTATDSGFHDVSKLTNFNTINKNFTNGSMDSSVAQPLSRASSSSRLHQNPIYSTLSTDASTKMDVNPKNTEKTSIGLGRPPLSPSPSFRSVATPVHGHGNASNNKVHPKEEEKKQFPWNILSFIGK